jgi:alpha-beta hydrolase superfamily lysophospholipase
MSAAREGSAGVTDAREIRTAAGRKVPIHFGTPGRTLFGFYHPPQPQERGAWRDVAVVLCNPIGTDYTRSDRTYRHLAERLSAAGFACLRFDLFGTGDSAGDERAPGLLRAWIDDIGVAIDECRARSGARAVALVGLRLGATLALMHAAERDDVSSLVLWSPCVSGGGYLAEIAKLHKVYMRIEPRLVGSPPSRVDGEEALGSFLPRTLIDDLTKLDSLRIARRPARRTLLIDGGNVQGRDALLGRLTELGAAPELREHPGHKFLVTVSHFALLPEDVIASIVDWLVAGHPADAALKDPAGSVAGPPPPFGEKPLVFGDRHPLFGILTPADPARAKPGRPAVVLSNAGCVNRVGPHRLYVRLARRWAQLGFDVLRVDISGVGDSPVAPGARENINYPPAGLEDLEQAIAAAGTRRAIIAGLCSGGDYAFQLGARDPRIAGALLLNPRTFCVLALSAVESADGAPPTDPVESVPRTLRAMAERGVHAVLLVSRNDPGVAYVDAHAGSDMHALEGVAGYHRFDLDASDHTFTPIAVQSRVIDVLTEHLAEHHA